MDEEFWELDKVNEALLKDIDRMEYDGAILDKDIELLQAHTKRYIVSIIFPLSFKLNVYILKLYLCFVFEVKVNRLHY